MAKKWGLKLDPTDHSWLVAMFDTVLVTGEKIATFDVDVDSLGAAHGLTIDETGATAAEKVEGDRGIKVWLSIEESHRNDTVFANGILLGVVVTIVTDAVPPSRWQRTWQVNVLQQ